MVIHSVDIICPLEVVPHQHGLNAGDFGLLKNFNVCEEVTPVNFEDGVAVETALVEVLEEPDVTVVGDPRL